MKDPTTVLACLIQRGWKAGLSTWTFLLLRWALTPYKQILASFDPKKNVLDFGCGHGLFSALLALRFSHAHVTALDHDEKRLQVGKTLFSKIKNISWRHPETEFPDFKNYDTVVALDVLHYFPPEDQEKFLTRVYDGLPAGGTLVFREVNPDGGFVSRWNYLYEWCATRIGFTVSQSSSLTMRSKDDWMNLMNRVGFQSSWKDCSHPLFSDVLFCGVKRA